jgi:hypothetical protein
MISSKFKQDKIVELITRQDFIDKELDSQTFYDLLPSDNIKISPDLVNTTAIEFAERLMESTEENIKESDLDELSIKLMNGCITIKKFPAWKQLADKLAICYSRLLLKEKARKKRMKLTRTNFFIRDLIDSGQTNMPVNEWFLDCKGPWDFLRLEEERFIWIDCEKESLKVRSKNVVRSYDCGLPTQIDYLSPAKVGLGSHYTNGGWILDGETLIKIKHHCPIVSFFNFQDSVCYLDIKGFISKQDGSVIGQIDADFSLIHRCRQRGNTLVFFDWSKPRSAFVYQLNDCSLKVFELDQVIICNDICFVGNFYYLIDKEQGYIFKFNEDFSYVSKILGLGKGEGRLYDPISIRCKNDELQVLNWFSGKVVETKIF